MSLWKSVSSSSPDAKALASESEPTSVDAWSEVFNSGSRGGYCWWITTGWEERPLNLPLEEGREVVRMPSEEAGEVGVRSRAVELGVGSGPFKSKLKLDSREIVGNGEEVFLVRGRGKVP